MIAPPDPLLGRPVKALPERAEDLALLAEQVAAIRREAALLTSGLGDEQFNWRPEPGRWSIAQCLQHLVVSADAFLEGQAAAIERARRGGVLSDGPYRHGRLGSMIVASIEPPVTWRFRAKAALAPGPRYALDTVVPAFNQRQERILAILGRARGVDLGRARVPIPGRPLVKLTLGQSLVMMLAHERRHLWQARQVRQDVRFPQ